jgi:hypothetical protein
MKRTHQSPLGEGENLIFAISQPRAGSTMLQKVLGAHPEIHTVSEPWIALHPLFALREKGIAADYDSALACTATREFLAHLHEGEAAYWESARRMLGQLYERALEVAGKRIFLDKTPRYYFVIPELRRVFPRARFVFLLRNPLAVLSSILQTWVRGDDPSHLRPFRHDLMTAPTLLLEGIRNFGPGVIVARYEELAAEPEAAVRRLCGQLGIEFHAGMIEYGAAVGGERWAFGDQGTVYRESRPVAKHAEHWRSVLKQSPVWEGWARSYLEALGADLVRELGYDYAGLSADFGTLPASRDWRTVTQSDAEAQALMAGRLESVAAERLSAMEEKDAELARLNEQLLHRAEVIEQQQSRLNLIESVAAERLSAMDEKDAELARLNEQLLRRAEVIAQQQSHLSQIESAAAERLSAVQEKDAELARLNEHLLHRAEIIAQQQSRLSQIESAAAERLMAMSEKDAELARLNEQLLRRAEVIEQQQSRLRQLEAAAASSGVPIIPAENQ